MKITAVILTLNEEKHLKRCIESISGIAHKIVVVDSYSTDSTLTIAESYGAIVIQNQWINHSAQFNWALSQLPSDTEWVLRVDADEILTDSLAEEIYECLPKLSEDIKGIYLHRRMAFQGKLIRYGGIFPIKVLRLFRYGHGECENRMMDEHIKVDGSTVCFNFELIDDNKNSFTWWINKHNKYASLEAAEILNLDYKFKEIITGRIESRHFDRAKLKRWAKEGVYQALPTGIGPLFYFLYRFFIRLGFLDGTYGAAFHFMQGFWYRYLVDLKVYEFKKAINSKELTVEQAITQLLGIKI